MGKFDNIVIISDMDGTFLGKDGRIVPENIEAIRYFNQNGGRFTVATGRNPLCELGELNNYKDIISAPVASLNAAYIYDIHKNELLYDNGLNCETVIEVFTFLRGYFPTISTSLRSLNGFYTMIPDKMEKWYEQYTENLFTFEKIDDIHKIKTGKMCFTCYDFEALAKVRKEVEKKFGDKIDCTTAEAQTTEIVSKGVSKASAVELLEKILNLENAKFFAVGDFENDLGMLKTADFGVCPENAIDAVKSIASFEVCHHDKGAIADLIRIIEEKYIG